MALSPKQSRFVAEYLVDLNGTQAAIRAGYSPRTAQEQSSRLLSKDIVSQAVLAGQERKLQKVGVTAERIVAELARIGFSDVRQLFNGNGQLKQPHELSDEAAAALASVEVTKERTYKRGEDVTEEEYVTKVRQWDKVQALALLAKHFGVTKESSAVNVNVLTKIELADVPDRVLDQVRLALKEIEQGK